MTMSKPLQYVFVLVTLVVGFFLFSQNIFAASISDNGINVDPSLGVPSCTDGIQNQDEKDVDVGGVCGGVYSSLYADTSERIGSSFNHLIQTLGTNLSGTLTKISIQTSNRSFRFYGSRPVLSLYECDDETYGSPLKNGTGCDFLYSGLSDDRSLLGPSIQSFDTGPIVFDPSKYYLFITNGNNIFNVLPIYYGSIENTVDGSCYHYFLTESISRPCVTVSDLYFDLYGIEKIEVPPCTLDCNSSVLFLPGLMGSRLYDEREGGSEDQLWEPNGNSDIEDLYLNTDGTSKNTGVYTRDIIKETNSPFPASFAGQNIYKSFANMMDDLVTDDKIGEWKYYAYDWRQSVDDIVANSTKHEEGVTSLVDTLQELVDSPENKNGQVTIVTHSNGGLLAKALLSKLQEDKDAGINELIDDVDVLIMIAAPEIGTANAVPSMIHGYDQRILGGVLMDEVHARELGRNMPGAFGLLPSREYMNRVSASPVTFSDTAIPSGVTTDMVEAFGAALSSYEEYQSFLFGGEGRDDPEPNQTNLPISLSTDLFSSAESLHDNIDAWVPPASLRVIEVAGWGLETVASYEYYPKYSCNSNVAGCEFVLDQRPRFTSDGDGTVIVPSAQYVSHISNAEKYWVNIERHNGQILGGFRRNREHSDILEINSLNDLIKSVIKNEEIVLDTVISSVAPVDTSNRLRLSIHSPVNIDAYDVDGNHTGKVCPEDSDFCYVEEEITNSSYMEFGEGKYLNLPEDQFSKVKLQGTGIGTFTFISEKVPPDGTSEISSFTDIPVTLQTQAEITLNQNTGEPELKLDVTGNGVFDIVLSPSEAFDPIVYLEIMKVTIESFDLPKSKIKSLSKKIDKIIKSILKGKIDKAELKAEKFKSYLEKKISKPDSKKPKPKKISKENSQLLLDMLERLVDNMG